MEVEKVKVTRRIILFLIIILPCLSVFVYRSFLNNTVEMGACAFFACIIQLTIIFFCHFFRDLLFKEIYVEKKDLCLFEKKEKTTFRISIFLCICWFVTTIFPILASEPNVIRFLHDIGINSIYTYDKEYEGVHLQDQDYKNYKKYLSENDLYYYQYTEGNYIKDHPNLIKNFPIHYNYKESLWDHEYKEAIVGVYEGGIFTTLFVLIILLVGFWLFVPILISIDNNCLYMKKEFNLWYESQKKEKEQKLAFTIQNQINEPFAGKQVCILAMKSDNPIAKSVKYDLLNLATGSISLKVETQYETDDFTSKDEEFIENVDLVILLANKNLDGSAEMHKRIICSMNLNKTIIPLVGNSSDVNYIKTNRQIRSKAYQYTLSADYDQFLRNTCPLLGLNNPMADATGNWLKLRVDSDKRYALGIDDKNYPFDTSVNLSLFFVEGKHTVTIKTTEGIILSKLYVFEPFNILKRRTFEESFDLTGLYKCNNDRKNIVEFNM